MNISIHNPPAALSAARRFAARRRYCLIRYRRIDAGPGVVIAGRTKLTGGTRLAPRAGKVTRQTLPAGGGGQAATGERTRIRGRCWTGADELVAVSHWCLTSDCTFDHDYCNAVPAKRHLPPGATRASVTKGLPIGAGSVTGAGSVVPGTVPAGTMPQPGPPSNPADSLLIPQTPGRPR